MEKTAEPANASTFFANCRSIKDFEKINTLGEGTYGTVFSARDKLTNELVAIKKVKIHDEKDGFPITSLREIKNLKALVGHPNIIGFKEVAVGYKKNSIFLVMEYSIMDLASLADRMYVENYSFAENEIKCIILQVLNGISFMHHRFQIHRDLKLSNLLINQEGIIKIADFGLSREYEAPINPYTLKVVTLWYRAPEILLEMKSYDEKVDVWSIGCILAEILNKGFPLFPGKNEINQYQLICEMIGYPSKIIWEDLHLCQRPEVLKELEKMKMYNTDNLAKKLPGASRSCLDLLHKMLCWDPKKRISINQAMLHPYFHDHPRPALPDEIKILRKLENFSKKNIESIEKKLKV